MLQVNLPTVFHSSYLLCLTYITV